jgi:hypothetical protein
LSLSDYDFPPVRPRVEIQRAHDLLTAIALDERLRRDLFEPGRLQVVKASLDSLCWVLHHDHNRTLAITLASLEVKLNALGIQLVEREYPDLTTGGTTE